MRIFMYMYSLFFLLVMQGWGINKKIRHQKKYSRGDQKIDIYKYLKHQKTIFPWNPLFLGPLQKFGDKTEHFCRICIVLEVEPLARKVFDGHWTWKSSIQRAQRCRFDSTCNTLEFEPFIFDGCFETYVGSKFVYVWFRVDLGLVWGLFQVGLESNYGWPRLV